jgi:hypothetical protein
MVAPAPEPAVPIAEESTALDHVTLDGVKLEGVALDTEPLPTVDRGQAAPLAVPTVDTLFEFLSGGQIIVVEEGRTVAAGPFSRRGQCRIRIFEQPDGTSVVIATELPDYQGVSVTNGAEAIATQVCLRYGPDPGRTAFIEHYDDRAELQKWAARGIQREIIGRTDGESFDFVIFQRIGEQLKNPLWKPATKATVEALIGGKLP